MPVVKAMSAQLRTPCLTGCGAHANRKRLDVTIVVRSGYGRLAVEDQARLRGGGEEEALGVKRYGRSEE